MPWHRHQNRVFICFSKLYCLNQRQRKLMLKRKGKSPPSFHTVSLEVYIRCVMLNSLAESFWKVNWAEVGSKFQEMLLSDFALDITFGSKRNGGATATCPSLRISGGVPDPAAAYYCPSYKCSEQTCNFAAGGIRRARIKCHLGCQASILPLFPFSCMDPAAA